MNIPVLIENITNEIRKAQDSKVLHNVIYLNNAPRPARHEFIFFIKPEITVADKSIKLDAILRLMFTRLEEFGFDIRDIRILGSSYLEQFNIIAQHYGVINSISRNAAGNMTPDATGRFRDHFGMLPQDALVLGGIEFLEKYRDFNPFSLEELWQKSKTVKLAGGTYCAHVKIEDDEVYLMNGFHPKQLVHFTERGRSIITFNLGSDIDWSIARNKFIGKTNPADAEAGSLRRELLDGMSELGLEAVNSSKNGFHLSAGPVEGLVELMRYCSDYSTAKMKTTDNFDFGRKLNASFAPIQVTRICANNYVDYNGAKISTYDLTEEKNADEAIRLLQESRLN